VNFSETGISTIITAVKSQCVQQGADPTAIDPIVRDVVQTYIPIDFFQHASSHPSAQGIPIEQLEAILQEDADQRPNYLATIADMAVEISMLRLARLPPPRDAGR
jgi:hypothetical protein